MGSLNDWCKIRSEEQPLGRQHPRRPYRGHPGQPDVGLPPLLSRAATLSHPVVNSLAGDNLLVMRIGALPDWLPDRWKAAHKTRLAALQNQTPHP